MTTIDIDRWIPDHEAHGYTLAQAREIAERCEQRQVEQPAREWTEILSDVTREVDAEVAS